MARVKGAERIEAQMMPFRKSALSRVSFKIENHEQ